METNKTSDFKANVADLTKIPPNEFEKYFQEWMERDDVARSLQAKLRCDLIKNFNKTNLGKHIISHTMSSTGGSSMRLTLSPLVLALNTLVAEFLYAQNCHFTLSVFCTEIPFRNTLPDFESMRKFRFNNEEIFEIWEAVTGYKANKKDLHKHVIHNYETNSNTSLLLLILKYLLRKDPLEQHKRNAEAQTETQEKLHKSISAQASERENNSPAKSAPKDDNLKHINNYLLKLSDKVLEMTKEFEQFTKQCHESRSRNLKSARSREYYTLNKSLERITENMKAMAQAKRKNKRLSNIVESIDNLTQQFGKCAEHFDNVTKVLSSRGEEKPAVAGEKPKRVKVKVKEKQTETELMEKSYADWIHDMRNTENGQKFLNKVEVSLRKALAKHREQLQNETDIKMKHLKSLMRLHYQQKLSKHLLHDPKINLEEARKCNDTIEKKLQQFELKQTELLQKLQESSLELREAQQQKQMERSSPRKEMNIVEKVGLPKSLNIQQTEAHKSLFEEQDPQQPINDMTNIQQKQTNIMLDKVNDSIPIIAKTDLVAKENQKEIDENPTILLKDVSKAQEEILNIAKTIAEQGRSVDHIIYDAKLRIQQLENESNQLEQNFQSYLDRRKRNQEQDAEKTKISSNFKENLNTISSLKQKLQANQITSARFLKYHKKRQFLEEEQDEEIDEEFQRLKETLQQTQEHNDKPKSAKSDSSTSSLEMRNAILEAKLKFFEHENTIRKCREQGDEIRTGNNLQKQLEKYPEMYELTDYINQSPMEININLKDNKEKRDLHMESSLSEINIKDKSLDEEHNIDLSPMIEYKSQKLESITPTSARRELFPQRVSEQRSTNSLADELKYKLKYHEPIPQHLKNLQNNSNLVDKVTQSNLKPTETTSDLIKQSMAKMQQLFEQQSKSQETLREMVNEIAQQRDLKAEDLQNVTKVQLYQRPNEALDKSLSTTITSTTTTNVTTNTSQTNEEIHMKGHTNVLNRISNTSMPSILNLSSDSEESMDSKQLEIEMTPDTIKEMEEEQGKTPTLTIKKPQEDLRHISESYESSELRSLPIPLKKIEEPQPNFEQEFGQIKDSPKMPDLDLYSPSNDKEIGEIFSESNRTFAPIDTKFSESSSTHSTSDLEISTGHQDKNAKNLADDSESDFWA